MKRLAWVAGLSLLLSTLVYAQRFGGGMRGGFGGGGRISSGFAGGRVGIGRGFHGIGPGFRGFGPGFHRFGPGFGGFRGHGGFRGGFFFGGFRHGFRTRLFVGPGFFGYPSYPYGFYGAAYPFYGGYYGGGGYYGDYYPAAPAYSQAPNVTVIYLPPYGAPSPESEVRREEDVRRDVTPEVREYGGGTAENAPRREQITFDIAMKNGPVYSALAYWVEGDTLNFIDASGKKNSVPLTSVDRKRSEELNRSKQVEFRLPAEK